ncbi:zinc ribbon domain-containing protein [Ruminococcus sp. Marseille-P6503]|uniref:zinc-ribbon domain-containing protein n=1 Tax=Ruminococcus sp. Marseille-P6503 TaxID=2364796 RepID=UPI0013DE34EC|nr:zinc ribbon domain-containing protein [Ruminococcus sp. Marseille-P6503]
MSKFCTTCGAQLDDGATFCTSCGAAQQEQPKQAEKTASAGETVKNTFNGIKDKVNVDAVKDSLSMENIKNLKTNPNKNTLIALACIAVVAILVIILVLNLIFGGKYKKPIANMLDGMEKADAAVFMKSVPKCQLDYLEETYVEDYEQYDSVEEYFEESLDTMMEYMEEEYGNDVKLSYSVEKKTKLSDSKLKSIRKDLEDRYDTDVEVTKGYKVKTEISIKGDDDDDDDTVTFTVAKVDGDWVIVEGSLF